MIQAKYCWPKQTGFKLRPQAGSAGAGELGF